MTAVRERFTTKEGVRGEVMRRGSIPLAAVRLLFSGGSAADPRGAEGLTDFMVRLMRRGTRKRNAEALDEAIERVGGSLEYGSSEDYAFLGVTVPIAHLQRLIEVLAEMVREPRFAPAEVRSARQRAIGELTNDLDDPGAVADRVLLPAIWGDHPYGHETVGSLRSLRRFDRSTVQALQVAQLGPSNVSVHVAGPVEGDAVRKLVEKAFRGWRGKGAPPSAPPQVERLAHPGEIWIVDKPEQTQVQYRLGGMTYRRGQPVAHALQVLNTAIGGGFTSRLVNQVRVERGLSYGVRSTLDPLRSSGSFTISSFTKIERARELHDVVTGVLRQVREEGLGTEELEHSKRYLAGTYPQRTESVATLAAALSEVSFYGMAEDWIERYPERVHAVTPADVRAAAEAYLLPEPPVVVLVGPAKELARQFADLGKPRLFTARSIA